MDVDDLVVCINDYFNPLLFNINGLGELKYPKKGKIYTIREFDCYADLINSKVGIRLQEIVNPETIDTGFGLAEISFSIKRFVKVDDITIEELMEEDLIVKGDRINLDMSY
jgi:hypothetical protein